MGLEEVELVLLLFLLTVGEEGGLSLNTVTHPDADNGRTRVVPWHLAGLMEERCRGGATSVGGGSQLVGLVGAFTELGDTSRIGATTAPWWRYMKRVAERSENRAPMDSLLVR